ncbi:MAG TPA: DUF3857 domain-containing protein [Candidatus Cybelea sp.]|nr:DUF3857 domain-containing protein [Candidatus Cybelea sp.]
MKHPLGALTATALFIAIAFSPRIPSSWAGDDWQPIDPADLALRDNPKSPGADAMVLYRETRVNEPLAYTQEYWRLKIFTKEGVKYGDVEVPYTKGEESITSLRGRTIQPDGKIVDFDGKVFDKVAERGGGLKVYVKAFSLPDVQPGAIVEYRYQKQLDERLYYIGFQQWAPEGELYTRLVRFSIFPLTRDVGQGEMTYRLVRLPEKVSPRLEPNGYQMFELHDIPGVEDEELMPPASAIRPRIEFFYRDPSEPKNETQEQYWKRIDKKLAEAQEKFLGKRSAIEQEVSHLVNAADPPEARLRKLYARTLAVRNLSMEVERSKKEQVGENLKPNTNAEDVLKHGYANEREINLLFVGLARAAGFDATGVYVAPANQNLFTPQSEEASQLGADLVWVRAGTGEYYLDPGARYYPFGLLPWYETGTKGIRLRKDGPEFITIPTQTSANATLTRRCQLSLNENGDATGKLEASFGGILGAMQREENRNEDETGRKKDLGDSIRAWLPSGANFEVTAIANWDDIAQPLEVDGTVKIPGLGTPAGQRMLVPVTVFVTAYRNVFKSTKRVNDIDFEHPLEQVDDLQYQAPGEYKVESLPTIAPIDLKAVVYQASSSEQGNMVEIKRQLDIEGIYYGMKDYEALRSFFNRVKSSDETQFVLRESGSAKVN